MIRAIPGFTRPFGVRAAPGGGFYAADLKTGELTRVGPDFVQAWRTVGSPAMKGAHSVAVLPDASVLVTDFYGRSVRRFRPDGSDAGVFAAADAARPWLLAGPAGLEIFPDGSIVVADYGSHCLLRFSPDGRLLSWHDGTSGWKTSGAPSGAASRDGFDRVHAAVVLPDGRMLVADTWNHRLRWFDERGDAAGAIGGPEAGRAPGSFDAPVSLALVPGGFVVSEFNNARVQRFTSDGRLVGWLGAPPAGWRTDAAAAVPSAAPGGFNHPYDVKTTDGALLIADTDNARVQVIPLDAK